MIDAHLGEITEIVVEGCDHATIVFAGIEETESFAQLREIFSPVPTVADT
jgi:hypothetical protein